MSADHPIPSPGSPEAQQLGCKCQPRDFDEPENPQYPGWLTVSCPLHGGAVINPE